VKGCNKARAVRNEPFICPCFFVSPELSFALLFVVFLVSLERASAVRSEEFGIRQGRLPGPCRRLPHHLRDTGQHPSGRCGRSGTQKGYLLN